MHIARSSVESKLAELKLAIINVARDGMSGALLEGVTTVCDSVLLYKAVNHHT